MILSEKVVKFTQTHKLRKSNYNMYEGWHIDDLDMNLMLDDFARQEVEKALKEPIQIIMQLVHSDDDICKCLVCKLGKPFLAQQTKQQ